MVANSQALWNQFRAGNSEAFGKIAQLHYRPLFNYGLRLTSDPDLVHDCIQQLYLELWEKKDSVSETEFVKTYLLRALRNKVVKELIRLKKLRQAGELAFETISEPSIEFTLIQNEHQLQQVQQLNQVINQLSKRQQEILYLRFYQNLEYEDISQIMGITKQSAANLLHRTIKDMKRSWNFLSFFFLNIFHWRFKMIILN
ncbi:RNA polymerase sigma factor [Dyadobacter sp. CY312]|uniref:RNA polymerase sigma factor n=1 Tax=Dyadobacter sp. CY312 TaxID=2907303 RepID=UPI001F442F34|nr:sigma-70 family RNA polymerase sigma factor [Dyadobacter sp. CY312]MCE7044564.1 sigma-70 family RNA polymerase sigma factor [Dyadobacter sp. CY312]